MLGDGARLFGRRLSGFLRSPPASLRLLFGGLGCSFIIVIRHVDLVLRVAAAALGLKLGPQPADEAE
jgi:hypothetical protein